MINHRKKKNLIGVVILCAAMLTLFVLTAALQAKSFWMNWGRYSVQVDHNLGSFETWHGVTSKARPFIGNFPNGSDRLHTCAKLRRTGVIGHFISDNGTEFGPPGSENNVWASGTNMGNWVEELPFGVWETTKFPIPQVVVDGKNANVYDSNPDVIWSVNPQQKADKVAVIYGKTAPGFFTRTTVYQMVNQYYGDFVIVKTTRILSFNDAPDNSTEPGEGWDTSQTFEDIYFFQEFQAIGGQQTNDYISNGMKWYGHDNQNRGISWMMVPTTVPGAEKDSLFINYGYDLDSKTANEFASGGPLWDDIGDPRKLPTPDGNLINVAYKGMAFLHVDKSASDKSDWVEQPYSVILTGNKDFRNADGPSIWDKYIEGKEGFRTPADAYDQTVTGAPYIYMTTFGPWDMNYQDSITYVFALGAGGISRPEARAIGAAWANWYIKGDVPEAYYNGELVTDAVKDRYVAQGKDSLIVTMQRAYELWENGLECPHPYPAPDLYVTSGDRSVTLKFTDVGKKYPNPNGGGDDVVAYRIYHKYGSVLDDAQEEAGRNVYWELVEEVPVDKLQRDPDDPDYFIYVDKGLIIGEDYYYSVTAVSGTRAGIHGDGPRLESSKWLNRTQVPAVPILFGRAALDSIYVVPNPYYIGARGMNLLSESGNRLSIYGLPDRCKIKIYNITGDLIREVNHTGGTAVDIWNQVTESNQYIAAGIYIAVITDAQREIKDKEGNITGTESIPGKKFIKFSVIR